MFPFFNNYPGTDLHEIDLAYTLKVCNEMLQRVNEQDDKIAAVEQLAQELQDFVNNYFDNLDVQTEINTKIDDMVADGSLLRLIEDPTADAAAEWLAAHITPTTPVVDSSLTIAGAAADAKVTGDNFTELRDDLDNLVVTAEMIDGSAGTATIEDFTDYTEVTNSYTDTDGTIKADPNNACVTTGFLDFADIPDVMIVEFGATVEAYSGRPCIVIKNTNNTYTYWIYSGLPSSFVTKADGVATINLAYLKNQGTRSQIAFNLTKNDYYLKYVDDSHTGHKTLDWLDVDYSQVKEAFTPENLYTQTCTAFGGSTVTGEYATITAVNQGILTNPFVTNSNKVRVTAKLYFTTPNVYVLLPYYANGAWNYSNILDIPNVRDNVEFTFDFDAAYYAVYHNATQFRLLFQVRSAAGVDDYSGAIRIASLKIEPLSLFKQYSYYEDNFVDMMINVFNGIDDAKSNGSIGSNIYVSPTGERYVLGVGASNQMIMIPVVPGKTLFCGNSLLLGMNTTATNHNYIYGMCATAPDKDYAHKVMNVITAEKPGATYDRVSGAAFEALGTNDSFSTLWNTTANVYTGEPLKNSFTSDLDLIIIQVSDNVNTADRREAFANNIDDFIASVKTASPNARIIWVYGWFYDAAVAQIISTACDKWGIIALNISSLHTPANEAVAGQSYIKGDGTTGTVSNSWITHAGDSGFTAIANSIVNALGIS